MQIYVINLISATLRREFQKNQLQQLGLNFEIINAFSADDIGKDTYDKHYFDWQRPLKNTEIACYFSHKKLWSKIIVDNQPALILEDDALLSKCMPDLLRALSNKKNIDLITLENRGRKKFIAKSGKNIACNSKLLRLYQDRTGAAGYILYPNGAKKLIQHEAKKGIALADAHITACHSIKAYQIEPTPIIQLDCCKHYDIENLVNEATAKSTVSSQSVPKSYWVFRFKRLYSQVKLGFRQLILIKKSERRYITIRRQDFQK